MGVGIEGRFSAAGHFDLGHEVGQVCFDGAFGDAEPTADLAIVGGVAEQGEDLAFPGVREGMAWRSPGVGGAAGIELKSSCGPVLWLSVVR